MSSAAIYAGSFDPITYGHLDLIKRAARVFDRLVIAVAEKPRKTLLFSLEERVTLVRSVVENIPNVEVDAFNGLLVEYARRRDISVVLRGLRAFSDFEFEFQMALTNRQLAPDVETIFLMPKEDYSYISSSSVREIAELGGALDRFVPKPVEEALRRKVG